MASALFLFLISCCLLAAQVSAMSSDVYINCGGPMLYEDSAGNVWVGDDNMTGNGNPPFYNTGRSYQTKSTITGTDDPALYATERWSGADMTYEIPVENGYYEVLLHFAEIYSKAEEPGARKFNVFIEQSLVLEEYDMYSLYGGHTAIIETFTTTVDDGMLTIDFVRGSIQNPKISAIEVHSAAEPTTITIETTTDKATTKDPETSSTTTEEATTTADEGGIVWKQVGENIDWMGSSIPDGSEDDNILSMSLDGNVVAVGHPQDATVSLFEYISNTGWNRFGSLGDGQDSSAFGYSISLNEDGKAIAVGDPGDGFIESDSMGRVFIYFRDENGEWGIRGKPISPSDEGEDDVNCGQAVSLSTDGRTVAVAHQIISRTPDPPNFVRVYRFNEDTSQWIPLGQNIFARLAGVNAPFYIDLCKDGTTLSIGSTVPGTGYVENYKYNAESSMWEMMGKPIETGLDSEAVGMAVSMSKDGSIVAFGTSIFGSSNVVRLYEFDNGEWKRIGADINSGGAVNARRLTLSVSGDGQRVAIGPQDQTPASSVYGWDGDNWTQLGEDIPSYELRPAGLQRQSIALSGDGEQVAVFAPGGLSVAVYSSSD